MTRRPCSLGSRDRRGSALGWWRGSHVDTTSFSVSGEYAAEEGETDEHLIAVTYGYSRDHRADLKQWMLALATSRQGDVPLYLQALDGNASDKVSLVAAVEALSAQLRRRAGRPRRVFVADSGLYSAENVARLNAAGVRWISRVPETSAGAAGRGGREQATWQQAGEVRGRRCPALGGGALGGGPHDLKASSGPVPRWHGKVEQTRAVGEALWHLSDQRFACEPDAQKALDAAAEAVPRWLRSHTQLRAHPNHDRPGRPRKDAPPTATSGRSRRR